jgi:hypothetical protein
MGATEPGQRVTHRNGSRLPPGSVVRNGDGSRIIHLHDDLWLWCKDGAWCYDRWENLAWRLNKQAVACHVAPNVELSEPGGPVASESGNRVAPPGFAPVSGSAAGRIVKKPQ